MAMPSLAELMGHEPRRKRTLAELAELDRRRAWCPPEACYTADFWQEECRRRGLPWSGQATHEAFWAPIHAALEKLRGAEDARHATAGEQLDLLAPEPDR